MLFLDLDRFKTINDSLGHARGDELLIAVADRLADALRAGDTAARLGGDEFAVLLDGLDDEREAVRVAKRMLEALRAPFDLGGQRRHVRARIGVATARGPAATCCATPTWPCTRPRRRAATASAPSTRDMHAAMRRSVALEPDLRRAMADDESVARVPADRGPGDRRDRAVEALVRWQHPSAASAPRVHPAGRGDRADRAARRWVLEEACRDGRELAGPTCAVSVNVSSVQLRSRRVRRRRSPRRCEPAV